MSRKGNLANMISMFIFVILVLFFVGFADVETPTPTKSTKPTISTNMLPTDAVVHALPEGVEPIFTKPEPIKPTQSEQEVTINFVTFNVPEKYNKKDFKSYEDYRAIKSKTSPHYKLQRYYADTAPNGIRIVDGRYCVALGSYFTDVIGQYVDVVLQNGTVIECILGDQKADKHTDSKHIAHLTDGSIVEFIIDKNVMTKEIVGLHGNVSFLYEEWNSPVVQIIVYDRNFFDCID